MADMPEKEGSIHLLPPKARRIGWAGAALIRLVSVTLRWRLHDPEGIVGNPPSRPMI